jgi:hypothetical protein
MFCGVGMTLEPIQNRGKFRLGTEHELSYRLGWGTTHLYGYRGSTLIGNRPTLRIAQPVKVAILNQLSQFRV